MSAADVDVACRAAAGAFTAFRELAPEVRANFLEEIARQLEARDAAIIDCAMQESSLPRPRLTGELGRTTSQLRFFASWLRAGHWAGLRIDSALPDRKPAPRPELRLRMVAVGPVAVFGAGNFPLAFSVAGGDTASALAAGCPVVVKAHPAHPRTSELAGEAIDAAVKACGLSAGVFSLVSGDGNAVGEALVKHPAIQAVGFTGSRRGGLALNALAQARPVPIPVYAEMSSINPVLVYPGALSERGEALAKEYVGSLTLGVGQFCTNPGLLLLPASPEGDRFVATAAEAIAAVPAQAMTAPALCDHYAAGVSKAAALARVRTVSTGPAADGLSRATLLETDAQTFLDTPALHDELFGPAGLIVRCRDVSDFRAILEQLEGQLTIALQIAVADHGDAAALMPLLETRAGRILVNGFGTGVEVAHAMVHGGPYPSTTDPRSTSVGTRAIDRFLRPVCYQNLPQDLLPALLREGGAPGFPCLVDGTLRT